jgi:hypothetical protein
MSEISTIDKKLSRTYFDYEKGRPVHRIKTMTWRYDSILDHRLGKIPLSTKTEIQEVNVLPINERPVKHTTLKAILKRIATDYETLLPISAFFTMDVTFDILTDEKYAQLYLINDSNKIFCTNFDETAPCSLSGNQDGITKKFGTPKKLNDSEAFALIQKHYPIVEEFQGEYKVII